ncbi:MAG: dCMP deaminase family protein [Oscillospiraceae bacterium]|nr:dCMP deaminase family protein [Oscillospiraceae bacterium]MCL1881573.1 dCMP deaminase family protein [Oscillospiraceae bacterium]
MTTSTRTRRDKCNYYLDIAQTVALRGTCLRRNFGAIIVNHDEIVSTGFNGAPRGRENCCDRESCVRIEQNIPAGTRYEICRAVHAEANCIISAARKDMLGGTLYLSCTKPENGEVLGEVEPCSMCKRLIINSGIETVIVRCNSDEYKTFMVQNWIDDDDTIVSEGY